MSMEVITGTLPTILCCVCGIEIQQNPANMCVTCLRDTIDVTSEIAKKVTIHSCRSCGRFLGPPWQEVDLESKELMAICLRKISGLNKVKLIDAVWIWTEPHSMRLKIKLTVQKEVMNGAILQQAAIVEFTIRNQQCKHCEASFAQGVWHAVVQVRQRVSHKRTFLFLEQLILKHQAHTDCVRIVTFKDGMDFYFGEKNQALRFIEFLSCHVPGKSKYSRKLISADHTSNNGNFKHNYLMELAPICKDDLIVLPKSMARKLSDISPLLLVKRVVAGIHVVDPLTSETHEINSEKYWRSPFQSIMTSRQLTRYIVLSVELILAPPPRPSVRQEKVKGKNKSKGGSLGFKRPIDSENTSYISSEPHQSQDFEMSVASHYSSGVIVDSGRKVQLAECVVVRERDFGVNDTQFTCVTHLGRILNEGDIVLGYDFTSTNWNLEDETINSLEAVKNFPDLILVRKQYDNAKDRKWSLKTMEEKETGELNTKDQQQMDDDYEDFMQELEGDKELRKNVNIYKKKKENNSTTIDVENEVTTKDHDDQEINLDELLDDMNLVEPEKKLKRDLNTITEELTHYEKERFSTKEEIDAMNKSLMMESKIISNQEMNKTTLFKPNHGI